MAQVNRPLAAALAVIILAAVPAFAAEGPSASSITPEAAIDRLFLGEEIQADWFAPAFLAQLPAAQVQAIVRQLTAPLGEYRGVTASGDRYLAEFEGGVVPVHIVLNASGQIAGLFLEPPRPHASGLEEAASRMAELPGRVALLVVKDGAVLASVEPDAPLAVGSAFKLAVLAALKEEIDAGRRSWSDVVPLTDEAKSLPSGVLHTWPTGSPLTLHTLAAQMISVSDNTATDALIRLLGRERVEAYAGRNRPFLTTRDAFVLKNPEHAQVLERFRAADPESRRAMLEELAGLSLPAPSVFTGDPIAPDVEWFFSARELCALMGEVQDLPLMRINPGVADPAEWAQVAFKGGSEPGVLALVTGLVDAEGGRYCVAAVWNDEQALDETRFFGMYATLLSTLAGR